MIRWATPGDVPAIRAVAAASWEHDYRFLTREAIRRGVAEWYRPERLVDELAEPTALILVAEADRRVVGFAHLRVDFRRGEGTILRLYVHPAWRSRGIGRALFSEAASTVAADGIERLRATALDGNPLGDRFYRALGFDPVDREWTEIDGRYYRENTYELDLRERPDPEAVESTDALVAP